MANIFQQNEAVLISVSTYAQKINRDPIKTAIKLGLDCRFPEKNQLFIDADTPEDTKAMFEGIKVLEVNGFSIRRISSTLSKSGIGHMHHVLETDLDFEARPDLRIAFQAALGSDRRRELHSILNTLENERLNQETPVNLFYERPTKKPIKKK